MSADQSGIGLPHSTTLARNIAPHSFREVMECGSPMPLLLLQSAVTFLFVGLLLLWGLDSLHIGSYAIIKKS